MTWGEALETVVAATGHERYRWLCSDDNPDDAQREGYRRIVLVMAGQPSPALSPARDAPPDEWAARIRACPDFNPGCCASPLPYCTRHAIHPTRDRCISCLSEQA